MKQQSIFPKIICFIIVPILIIIMGFLMVGSVKDDTATTDEAIHILSAYLSLTDNDYSLDPEHPFLAKKISALPLLVLQPTIDYTDQVFTVAKDYFYDSWVETREAAQNFLYNWGNNADQILLYSRLPNILLTLIFALVFYLITKKFFGWKAAIFSLLLFVFSPNILAHGRLANTDLWYTFVYFVAVFSYTWYLESLQLTAYSLQLDENSPKINKNKLINQRYFRLVLASLAFGLALAVKFSSVTLPIILGSIWLASYLLNKDKLKFWSYLGKALLDAVIIAVIGLLIVWASYGFSIASINDYLGAQAGFIAGNYNRVLITIEPLVAYLKPAAYWKGIALTLGSALGARPAYLLGMFSFGGWWYYFPIVFMVKTPLVTIILLIASIIFYAIWKQKFKFYRWVVLLSILVFFIITLFSKLNLGVRHLLPIYPFIFVWLGIFISDLITKYWSKYRYLLATILIILFGFYIYSSLNIYPSYLSYFNEAVGGAKAGGNYLADSNIDWGQDLKRLQQYLAENNITESIKLEYFWTGDAGPTYYGINWVKLEPDNPNQTGYIAIGASALQSPEYDWLKQYEPIARVGQSVYVYNLD